MTTAEVATELAALCRNGRFLEAIETFYAADIVSVEARELGGMPREMRGKDAVKGKNVWWLDNNEVHSVSVTGPFVSPERFALILTFDRTYKPTGERSQFSEVAVYTVVDGKISRDEFLYAGF
jgi:hypothetical protein